MQWTDIKIITDKKFEDIFDFVSAEICPMGVQIEDYSDLEQEVENIAHVDLIEQELLDKDRNEIIVHHYISPEMDAQNARLTLENRLDELGVTYKCEIEYVNQEDWETGWKKYSFTEMFESRFQHRGKTCGLPLLGRILPCRQKSFKT